MHPMGSRACGHDLCRIFGSAALSQRSQWLLHIEYLPIMRSYLDLAAFLPIASAPFPLAQLQPGAEYRAFLERI